MAFTVASSTVCEGQQLVYYSSGSLGVPRGKMVTQK